jgi:hypothetical protein
MPTWNTEKIIEDLKATVPNIKKIENTGQGGDYDTDNLVISFTNTKDKLWVYGFNVEKTCTKPENCKVEYAVVTDGMDSRGGLNSSNYNLALGFINIRQYFINKKFDVVNTIDDYF